MTSWAKIPATVKRTKQQPTKIKPTIPKTNAVLAERMSKYFLLSK